jgi:apolipoprotein N-acyltransferase
MFDKKMPRLLAALVSGGLTALAFPKFNLSILAWISLIPLLAVLARSRPKAAFGYGLAAGAAFYGVLLYWLPDVPAHYGNLPMSVSLGIYLLLILYLGSYWAWFAALFAWTRRSYPAAAFLAAPFLWVAQEYLIGRILTGFPWGLLGYSQSADVPFLQLSTLTGVYGLSFVLVLLQSTFVLAMSQRKRVPFFAAMGLLAAVHAAGWMSMNTIAPGPDSLKASVIQGNVSSDLEWDFMSAPEFREIFDSHMDLTRKAVDEGGRLVIWPEFTVPLCFSCPEGIYAEFSSVLRAFARENGTTLLLGTNEQTGSAGKMKYYNSAVCVHPDGTSTLYSKMHLVPFGEYTPYTAVFAFIEKITHAIGDITPGSQIVLHESSGVRFGSPICYEIIFPDLVRRFAKAGAEFLVTITNDGWYGRSSAPRQHFAIAVFRAVENRRFLLRAATTGISGIIDPYGRVLSRTKLMTRNILTGTVTPSSKTTFYTRHGDVLALACLTASLLAFIMGLSDINNWKRDRYAHRRNIIRS